MFCGREEVFDIGPKFFSNCLIENLRLNFRAAINMKYTGDYKTD